MQTNTLTLPVNIFERMGFNKSVLYRSKTYISEQVINRYNSLLYQFNQIENSNYHQKIMIFNSLKAILLANGISLPWRVERISKLINKINKLKYCASKLHSLHTKKKLNSLLSTYIEKISTVDAQIKKYLKAKNCFPTLIPNAVISTEKYFSSINKKYSQLLPFFNFVHDEEFIEDYNMLRKKLAVFYSQFEAIHLFNNKVDCSEFETLHTAVVLLNKIYYLNSLVLKLEKYAKKHKYNLDDDIEQLENDIFDMSDLFDSKALQLKSSLGNLVKL